MAGPRSPEIDEGRLTLSAAIPLVALVAAAPVLFWIADRAGSAAGAGGFDRGQLALLLVPLWLVAPVATGALWRRRPPRVARRAAVFGGTAVAIVSTVWIWTAVALPTNCVYGPLPGAEAKILPSAVVGLLLGGLITWAAWISRTSLTPRIVIGGVAVGVGASVVASAVAIFAAIWLLGGANCVSGP